MTMKYYLSKSNTMAVCYKVEGKNCWFWSWISSSWEFRYSYGYGFGDKKNFKKVTKKEFEARIKKGIK